MNKNVWFEKALLPGGWAQGVTIAMEGGVIASVNAGTSLPPAMEHFALALPGMPNLHSHAFQHGMAGLTETRGPGNDSFWTWREAMYRFLDVMTPEDMQAIAAQAYATMLENGFTHVAEFHYFHHDTNGAAYDDVGELSARIAAASDEAGIGLTLLPVFYAHAGFGGQNPTHGQRRFINDHDRFVRIAERARDATRNLPQARTGIAPHSLRAVTPDELAAVVKAFPDGPIHIHVAEQVKEVEDCLAWSGQRPVEWLLDHAPVDQRWCLIHATHMTETETRNMARSGAVAGLCPLTEANLGDGFFPAPAFCAQGGRFGIGSDSNVRLSMPGELEILEYGQRLALRARNVMAQQAGQSTGRALFDAALQGGAQACDMADAGLRAGACANFITLKADHPALSAARDDAIIDALIFARHDLIDTVWRNGKKIVADGQHRDRDRIARNYRAAMRRMMDAA
ncbi:MAG: formimidoylglutamate deiminase [Beijerinckiaceae bacterium]